MSPDFEFQLKLVLQGGLAFAQSGALAMEYMENTRAVKHARNARHRAQSRRHVQTGGVRYPSKARQMVKQRENAELEKAEIQLRSTRNAKKTADTTAHKPFLDQI